MAAKKKAAKAGAAAVAAKNSPYVQRIIEDEELRESIWGAYEAATKAYKRLGNGKSPAKQIFDDKRLQRELQTAAVSLRDAGVSLREAPKAKKGGHFGRKLLLVVITGGVALALSESLRTKALDLLFGAEEEFEYSAAAPAATPATANANN